MSLAGTPEIASNLTRFRNVVALSPQNLIPNQNDVAAATLNGTHFHVPKQTLKACNATRFPSFTPNNPNSLLHSSNTSSAAATDDPPFLLLFAAGEASSVTELEQVLLLLLLAFIISFGAAAQDSEDEKGTESSSEGISGEQELQVDEKRQGVAPEN